MSTLVNILLLGKIPNHLKTVTDVLQPEYQVIQTASSTDDAAKVLPSLISATDGKKIDLIIMGGGFSPNDFENVRAVDGAKSVPWLRPDPESIQAAAGQAPPAEVVAGRVRKALDSKVGELKSGKGEGEVWFF